MLPSHYHTNDLPSPSTSVAHALVACIDPLFSSLLDLDDYPHPSSPQWFTKDFQFVASHSDHDMALSLPFLSHIGFLF